jgi:hypothetical protein
MRIARGNILGTALPESKCDGVIVEVLRTSDILSPGLSVQQQQWKALKMTEIPGMRQAEYPEVPDFLEVLFNFWGWPGGARGEQLSARRNFFFAGWTLLPERAGER